MLVVVGGKGVKRKMDSGIRACDCPNGWLQKHLDALFLLPSKHGADFGGRSLLSKLPTGTEYTMFVRPFC